MTAAGAWRQGAGAGGADVAGAIVPFRSSGAAADQTAPSRLVQVAGVALQLQQNPQQSQALAPTAAAAATTTAAAQTDWLIDMEAHEAAAAHPNTTSAPAAATSTTAAAAAGAVPLAQPHLANVGLVVWQSGLVLAQLLAERPPLRSWAGVHLLDLGAGTGVVGLALARHGAARVTLTDLPHILPLLKRNAEANMCTPATGVEVVAHRWGDVASVGPLLQQVGGSRPDVITAADVLYDVSQHQPLLASIAALSAPHTVTFISWRKRSVQEERFAQQAEAMGFAVEAVPDELLAEEYQGDAYAVLRLAWRDVPQQLQQEQQLATGPAARQGDGDEEEEDVDVDVEHRPCRQQ